MKPELESRHDSEVSAAPAEGPEEVLVLLLARRQNLPVGSHYFGAEEVVAREAGSSREVADAASEGEPAHTRRGHNASRGRKTVRIRRIVEDAPGRAPSGPGSQLLGIDLHIPHTRQVDDECVVRGPETRDAVPSSAYRQLEPALTGERDCGYHVVGAGAPYDERRSPIDHRVEHPACILVPLVVRGDDLAANALAEAFDGSSAH